MTRPLLLAFFLPLALAAQTPNPAGRTYLRQWQIQSACKVEAKGDTISTAAFKPQGWLAANVPSTVLAAQVAAGVFQNPYYGMNLRQIPGTTYPIGRMFATLPMADDSPYKCAWWYRAEFPLPNIRKFPHPEYWLHFAGINYRANLWVNGRQVADSDHMAGMWREWEYNVTRELQPGTNVVAIEVFAQKENDLGLTFVDWNPMPPDKNLGLWRPVWLDETGPVRMRNAVIFSQVDPNLRFANLSGSVELENATDERVSGVLEVLANAAGAPPTTGKAVSVTLAPREKRTVSIEFLRHIQEPRLWWPFGWGSQVLNEATFGLQIVRLGQVIELPMPSRNLVSDRKTVTFAMRSVTSELTSDGHRLFKINGKPFLVRGGGWTPDMMLRQTPERLQAEFNYVRDMHLNTLRLEGKLETDEFFDLADRMGIMVMAGWCCCDHWEKWQNWKPEDYEISAASLRDQLLRLRNHPSVLVWLNGSDNPPPAKVEERYVSVLKELAWPNPYISSATAKPTTVTGKTGVKMSGPYDFIPPNYWLLDTAKYGGAYGFNTETGPGPAIPPAQCIQKMLPHEHWWPIDDWWNYHAGAGSFKQMDIYNRALAERYGASSSMPEYTVKSQAAAYDGERAMFEGYLRNRYTSTGVIQWMLNNAWPSMIWHLYDYFLQPAGGYFGTKKANEPVHVMFGYDDGTVAVSNLTGAALKGAVVKARLLNFDMTEKWSQTATVDVGPDAVVRALTLPARDDLSRVYFLDLRLADAAGKPLSTNFYWLSTRPDLLDWSKSNYFYTPEQQYADLTDLNKLPPVKLAVSSDLGTPHPPGRVRITVTNPAASLAFMVRLRVTDPAGDEILPVLWEDNYFSLLPGESRTVTATFSDAARNPLVAVEGWNVAPVVEAGTPKSK